MNSYDPLKTSETRLEGGYRVESGTLVPDEISQRISFLKKEVLQVLATDSTGWQILYLNPEDGSYWELIYPDGEQQGGGGSLLRRIDEKFAKQRYHF